MSRVAKQDTFAAVDFVVSSLKAAGGQDGRVSRADAENFVASGKTKKTATPTLYPAADMFFKWADHRDASTGATVTAKDLDKSAETAKETLLAKYDTNKNGFSAEEIAKMSTTAKMLVKLAAEMKASSK